MRTIALPAIDKVVSLKAYLSAVRMAKANPDEEFKTGFTCWWPCTGREIVSQFLEGVEDRINKGIPYSKRCAELAPCGLCKSRRCRDSQLNQAMSDGRALS